MAITLEELQIKFIAETGALKSQLSGVQKQLTGLETSAEKAQNSLGFLKKAGSFLGGAMIGRKLINVGKDALMMANDVVESEQLFEVSMGRMEARAREWSDNLGESLGLNPYDLRRNAGMLNVMFGSMGLGEQEAYDMSTSMVQLANDMASFYNLDTEEAFTKLRAGITGETEPLKRLGILVDENTIKQYAMANGISKTGKEMTQTQKLQARYGAIMQQTMKAQGDLARTMDSPTNQLRILNNQFDQAKIALGQALQPALIAVLPHVTNFATGLANVMSGKGDTNPFNDVVVKLSDAVDSVRGGMSQANQELMAEVKTAQDTIDQAFANFATAAGETKTYYLTLTLQPKTNAYGRIKGLLQSIEWYADLKTAQDIEKDVTVMMNAALEDGEVSEEEVEAIRELIRTKIQEILDKREAEHTAFNEQVDADLHAGKIDIDEARSKLEAEKESFEADTAGLKAIEVKLNANLSIKDWKANTIPPEDVNTMHELLQAEVTRAIEAAKAGQGKAAMLFAGTGSIGAAVDLLFEDMIAGITGYGDKINEAFTEAIAKGVEPPWDKINEYKQEIARFTAVLSGEYTSGAKYQQALYDLNNITPETAKNFGKAYADNLEAERKASQEAYKMQEQMIYEFLAAGETEKLNAFLKEKRFDGTAYEAIEQLRSMAESRNVAASEATWAETIPMLVPQLEKIINDPKTSQESATEWKDILGKMVEGINLAELSEQGKKDFELLSTLQSKFAELETYMSKMSTTWGWTDYYNNMTGDFERPTWKQPLTQYYDPLAHEGLNLQVGTLSVERPRLNMDTRGTTTFAGRGGSFDLNVTNEPQNIYVTVELDEVPLGRAVVQSQRTVSKMTGGGSGQTYGPTALLN